MKNANDVPSLVFELKKKTKFRIYKTGWIKREELDSQLGNTNVIYILLDTKNKLIYIGEAKDLIKRLKGSHPSIKNWDYFRYDTLPDEFADYRVTLERMIVRDMASLFENKGEIRNMLSTKYKLTNDRIDIRGAMKKE